MFAIADKSISIQYLHYKRKYRYVKSYVTTVVTATHGFGSKTVALITNIVSSPAEKASNNA